MVRLSKKEQDAEMDAAIRFNKQSEINLDRKLREGIDREKIQDYANDKYIRPNLSILKGTPTALEWSKLFKEGKFKTEADVDKFFESKLGKEENPKKKVSKSDIKKLFKEVKATKMPSSFSPEIKSINEKLKEIASLMSKPKKII